MILSKGNLLVVSITKRDSRQRVLDNVHVAEDGTTVGSSGRSVLAVSPVREKVKAQLPFSSLKVEGKKVWKAVTITAESVRAILKDMPKDKLYGGMLEHVDVRRKGDGVVAEMNDGKRKRRVEAKRYPLKYIPFRGIFGKMMGRKGTRVVLNLDRLVTLLKTVHEICDDDSAEVPVFLEFTGENDVIVRSVNRMTGQRVVGVMTSYKGIEGKWLGTSKWERRLACTD